MPTYNTLQILNNRNSVFLVENTKDKKLYVKKYIEDNSIKIYEKMLNIKHKNIPRIYQIFRENDIPTVIEEYIEGESLFDIIEKRGILEISEVRDIICQLCNGIKCIHKIGIVHRDITPNNVIIDNKGTVKLIDMGISRIKNREKSVDTTLMGTEGYAAPEQFGFRQTDEKSDIFSIGVLINVMLTGEFPSAKIYRGNATIENIILRCIEIDPLKRFKNIDEIKYLMKSAVTEKDSLIIKFFKELPGFRSKKLYKIIIALLYYAFLIWFTGFNIYCYFDNHNIVYLIQAIILIIAVIIIPWLIMTNYKYYIDRLKLTKNLSHWLKNIICIFLGFSYQIIAFIIFYIIVIV
ncbi:MAG: serine/threonine-protein kinase [Lachnospirales bacterium]